MSDDADVAPLRRRLGLVAGVYAYRAAIAALAGLGPGVLGARASGSLPGGDAELFAPGSVVLMETFRRATQHGGATVAVGAAVLIVFGVVLGALPLGALLVGLARPGEVRTADVLAGASRRLGRLLALVAAALGGQILAALAIGSVGAKLVGVVHPGRGGEVAWLVVGAALWLGVASIGCLRDVAAAAVVTRDLRFTDALGDALVGIEKRWARLSAGYVARALAAFALVLGVVWFVPWGSAARIGTFSVALVHQVTAFAVVTLQASWLRACVRAVPPPKALAPEEVIAEHPTP